MEAGDEILEFDETSLLQAAKEIRNRRRDTRNAEQVKEEAKAKRPKRATWKITNDETVVRCDLLLVDPPYGSTKERWEPADLGAFTVEWCRRWSKCRANFVAVFWSQEKLFEGREWLDEGLEGYKYQQLLSCIHGNKYSANHKGSTKFLKRAWSPIFLYRRKDNTRGILEGGKEWTSELTHRDCIIDCLPQINYTKDQLRQHPCQKSVAVMRWLIHALTQPGEKVVSPFCGVAPCGIAAVQLGRRYLGIEKDRRYRKLAERRVAVYG